MNIQQIRAFRTVMRAGSVTSAAELLQLTQPTISKLIAQLERDIKLKLFDRSRGRLVPRPEAHSLLRNVDNVFQALDEVGQYAKQLARSHTGHLRISATPSLGAYFLPLAMAEFMAEHHDVRVTFNVGSTGEVTEWVQSHQADIGFVTDSPAAIGMPSERFQQRTGAICLLPRGHRLSKKGEIQARDLVDTRVILLDRDTPFHHVIKRSFVEAGLSSQMVLETNRFSAAAALVAKGVGVSVLDPFAAFSCHRDESVLLRPFKANAKFSVDIIRAAGSSKSLLVEEFLKQVTKQRVKMEHLLYQAFSERQEG